jgi:hypothetical protein
MQCYKMFAVMLAIAVSAGIAAPVVGATAQQTQTPKPAPKVQTVYITKTGKKYHQDSCRHLAKSRIEIPLADAKKRGYTACAVCYRKNGVR